MANILDIKPITSFSKELRNAMERKGVRTKDLADQLGLNPNHVTKMLAGSTFPSPLSLRDICKILGLKLDEMTRVVVVDKISKKHGGIPFEFAGSHPELMRLIPMWDQLKPEQKQMLVGQIEIMVKQNGVARRKRA
jgi:transcriptional regulator with XRE-family HTH domain